MDRRLQVLLDEDRHQRLVDAAEERGVSVATIVRETIDRGLPNSAARRRAAWERLSAGPDIPVPDDPADLKAEIASARDRFG